MSPRRRTTAVVPEPAPDRLARLLAMIPYLLAHPGTRMDEISELFGVPVSRIRDDLNLIWMCGLPGHYPGDLIDVSIVGDRVTVSNADPIARPLRLSAAEGLAVRVALRTLAELPGIEADADAARSALAKIDAAATASVEDRIAVAPVAAPEQLPEVRRAIAERHRLELDYFVPSRDELTHRVVDPIRLHLAGDHYYLEAFCHTARENRLFRVDRIAHVSVSDEPADEYPSIRDPRAGYRPGPGDIEVRLEVGPGADWVVDYYPATSRRPLADGWSEITLLTADPSWVIRLALRLGGQLRIVNPLDLASRATAAATRALARYDQGASADGPQGAPASGDTLLPGVGKPKGP